MILKNTNITNKKVEVLFQQGQIALLTISLATLLIVLVVWEYSEPVVLATWLAIYLVFNGWRYRYIRKFNHSHIEIEDYSSWFNRYRTDTIISGCLWGSLCVYLLITNPSDTAAIVIFLVGYMTITAAVAYCSFISVYLGYILPIALPTIFYFLMQNDNQVKATGIFLSIFLVYALLSSKRFKKMVESSISLQFDNLQLLDELEIEKVQASKLNEKLELEIDKLRETEENLRFEKQKADVLANHLLTLSSQDGLTGIANRRQFDQILAKEWNRALRSHAPLSLIMGDIDHFKAFNDYYGHQKGDNCLCRIAHLLEENARRGGDTAARYGGEEFAIILPETNLENATEVAEQIRHAIEEIAIPHEASMSNNIVTMSFGVSTIVPSQAQQSRLLISMADKALYQAKQKGRNCVVKAMPELHEERKLLG